MEAQSFRRRRFALATFACLIVGLLTSAPAALAVHSDQYDAFQNPTSCPTDSPYLNDPEFSEVACVATAASHTFFKLGNFETEISTPTTLGFAFVAENPALNVSSCAEACYDAVPGSTVLSVAPVRIDLPFGGNHKPPKVPKAHGWHWSPWHGKGKVFHKRKLLHGSPAPSIEATIESAGDLHSFVLFPSATSPLLRLPVKIHLEGHLLGNSCYIGSNASPIELALFPIAEPEVGLLPDPNELPVALLFMNGAQVANNTFSVPAADGCGPAVGFGKHKFHPLDAVLNSILGLPSPAGQNGIMLTGMQAGLALAFNGGGGGAALKAAFEAANAP